MKNRGHREYVMDDRWISRLHIIQLLQPFWPGTTRQKPYVKSKTPKIDINVTHYMSLHCRCLNLFNINKYWFNRIIEVLFFSHVVFSIIVLRLHQIRSTQQYTTSILLNSSLIHSQYSISTLTNSIIETTDALIISSSDLLELNHAEVVLLKQCPLKHFISFQYWLVSDIWHY